MSKKNNSIVLFREKQVRRHWNEDEDLWYFSIVDIIEVLAENKRPRKYWNDLKKKLLAEGNQLSEKIGQLKMKSLDGKFYKTDVLDTENVLRLIQSIPSPNYFFKRYKAFARNKTKKNKIIILCQTN